MKYVKIRSQPEKKIKIFLDMDGVLADFDAMYKKIAGVDLPEKGTMSKQDDEKMWNKIRDYGRFFHDMIPTKNFKHLISLVERYDPDPTILSAIGIDPNVKKLTDQNSYKGKQAWIQKRLDSGYLSRAKLINGKKTKPRYIDKDAISVLIDDDKENIKNWNSAGGHGFLFNNKDGSVLKKLENFLNQFNS